MYILRLVLLLVLVATLVEGQRKRQSRPTDTRPETPIRTRSDLACDGDISFELITGFVYSSADDIMDTKVGTLMLSECMDHCRTNPECRALNFETGLCVLFRTAAGENSGALAVSQFPVFTIYAQKVCLPQERPVCSTPWAYESVPDVALTPSFVVSTRPAASKGECAVICLQEDKFTCRAASFDSSSSTCSLSRVDRNMATRKHLIELNPNGNYVEVACKPKPENMCEFQELRGRILKTVDAVYQDVHSIEQCRDRCLKSNFTCYSYDYISSAEKICRLSHHSTATLAHIDEPYLEIENATTFERQSCYQVSVECRGAEMLARISTSTLFDGKVYAKTRPNSCVIDIEDTTDFEITIPYNDINCDVRQDDPGTFSSNIVIQHHDMIVTSADVGLALHCKYELNNQTVTNSLLSGLEVKSAIETADFFEETIVESPNVIMRVTNPKGEDVLTAQVGDNLALRFEITDAYSPYGIFVRELVALDGQDNSEILLIDNKGCPTDPTIMQSVIQMGSVSIMHAPFHAFKFPASEVVQFRALVTPCMPECEPVQCDVQGFDGLFRREHSLGRKKREVEKGIMLAQSVRITDKFAFAASQKEEVDVEVAQGSCSTFTGVVVACALFLAAQLVLLMAWSYLWHKKRASKQIDPTPPSLYFGVPSSRASSTSYLTD